MHNAESNDEDLKAPPRLVAALQKAARKPVFIPPTLDEAILASARKHLARPNRKKAFWFRLLAWSAAPATLLIIFLLNRASQPGFAREDLNHDGKVDILDAFQLARELRAGQPLPPARDINGDGIVDSQDVQRIASDSVRLTKGGRS